MPPLPRFRSPEMQGLAGRLLHMDPPGLARAIEGCEALAGEIEPRTPYPVEWIEFKLSPGSCPGERLPGVITGDAVLQDLSALCEHLCDGAALRPEDVPDGLTLTQVMERWNASAQTIARLRRRGLVARRVTGERRRAWLVFTPAHVRLFEQVRRGEISRPAAYSRITPEDERKIRRHAERLRRWAGLSVSAAAKKIAPRFGRSHEAIRQLLLREPTPGVPGHALVAGPVLDARRRRVLYRAWRLGVDTGLMARKYSRSRGAIRRAINVRRAELLRAILERTPVLRNAPAIDAGRVEELVTPAPARTGLGAPGARTLRVLIDDARSAGPPIGVEERARLGAYHALCSDCARRIALLDRLNPGASDIDMIETRLRWAARLKAELLRPQWRLILETLQARLPVPLTELSGAEVGRAIRAMIDGAGAVIESLDPGRGARVAAGVGLAVDRAAVEFARRVSTRSSGRARPLVDDTPLEDWTAHVAPWQPMMEPDPRLREVLERRLVPRAVADVLRWRFGWNSLPPMTLVELAARLGKRGPRAAAVEAGALRQALRAAREGAPRR